jgi:hypothetical protein
MRLLSVNTVEQILPNCVLHNTDFTKFCKKVFIVKNKFGALLRGSNAGSTLNNLEGHNLKRSTHASFI